MSLGPASAPLCGVLGLERGQSLVEGFLAILAEELSRAYTTRLKRALDDRARRSAQSEERLLSLQMVAGAVAQERDQELTLDLIARQVVKLTGADTASVYLPDEEAGLMRSAICITPQGDEVPSESFRSRGLRWATSTGAAICSSPTTPTTPPKTRSPRGSWPRSGHAIRVIGVLGVEKLDGATFTRADVELLGLFADQAAIALENARLFRETNRRNEEVSNPLPDRRGCQPLARPRPHPR